MINLPKDYVNRIKEQLGDEAEDFFKSYEEPYVKALRINRLKNPNEILFDECTDVKNDYHMDENHPVHEICENAKKSNLHKCRVAWENRGIYYDDESLVSPGKSPLHAAGAFYIQEASAMYPVAKMFQNEFNAKKDNKSLKILDLCAAPGGKTTQIADYMGGMGTLICNEIIPSRAKILSENIERMGVTNALVISDEPQKLADRFPRFFDRILVDAPCSGEGMFRKHPEATSEWSEENVKICADRQDMILDCAARMLASGGKITYSTCTFSVEEDEGSVERFLSRHPEFTLFGSTHRIFPHRDKGEGHFCAEFVFADDDYMATSIATKKDKKKPSRNGQNNKNLLVSADKVKVLNDFLGDALSKEGIDYLKNELAEDDFEDRLVGFGDNIYLAPQDMPDIKGLKVLRPGLQLGTVKNGRFEPSHGLALALKPSFVKTYADLSMDDAKSFTKGMTVNCDKPLKGWCLVCVSGISLGWGKANGNIIKNHYPKGLRVME